MPAMIATNAAASQSISTGMENSSDIRDSTHPRSKRAKRHDLARWRT
jgi:hypothetical protein